MLGSALRILAGDQKMFESLRSDRDKIPPFVEEVLRLESPVQGLFRTATRDTVLGGTRIPAGSALYVGYGTANRDGAEFACPAELDLRRKNLRAHLAFGHGPHVCLGAALARLEGRVALEAVFDRFRGLEFLDAQAVRSYSIRGMEHLWLQAESAG
jgi:cytochrome P450